MTAVGRERLHLCWTLRQMFPASQVRLWGMSPPQSLQGSLSKLLSATIPGQFWVVRAHFCCVQSGWAEQTAGKQIWSWSPFPLTSTTQGKWLNSSVVLSPVSLICRAWSEVFLLLLSTPIKTSSRLCLAESQWHQNQSLLTGHNQLGLALEVSQRGREHLPTALCQVLWSVHLNSGC